MAEKDFIFVSLDYIKSMAGDNEELIKEMAEIFVKQIPEFNELFNDLYEKGDYYNLGMQAHKAKSSVAIMGMDDLAVMLKEFELMAKEGKQPEKYPEFIRRFREETAGAVEELTHHFSL